MGIGNREEKRSKRRRDVARFLIGWGCSGASNKVELTVEFLPSDWLDATQVTGFVLIQIFETVSFKRPRKREKFVCCCLTAVFIGCSAVKL